jgi:hypothetical protein
VKGEIITALGKIRYPQALAYLKYEIENTDRTDLADLAKNSVRQIDPAAMKLPAAQLFYNLAEDYYYHAQSLSPAEDADFANIWFWYKEKKKLVSEQVDKAYFNELMAMRCCEWAVNADPEKGQAIGLWLAAFFKAESTGLKMPGYFGQGHADASTYATTAGPEYTHQALARALRDNNAHVALGAVEALIKSAGEKSLFHRFGAEQPLVEALSFGDRAVRYSAAIAIAGAGPSENFPQSRLVIANLAEAVGPPEQQDADWSSQRTDDYAFRAATVMLKAAETRNPVIDLTAARDALITGTRDERPGIQTLSADILAHMPSPDAQRAIASMALAEENPKDIRISAFKSLAVSAKLNANLLDDQRIDRLYALVGSQEADPQLRSAAAAAYGTLNLPSRKVKDLILDQAKS